MATSIDVDGETFTALKGYTSVDYGDSSYISIVNKKVGDMSSQITVSGDVNSQYIVFLCNRYEKNIDLSEKTIRVCYETPDKTKATGPVVNVEVSKSYLKFGWVIPENALKTSGKLKVMPYFYSVTDETVSYMLKSLYSTITIYEGLEVS